MTDDTGPTHPNFEDFGQDAERERVKELASAVGGPAARRLIDLFCQGITKGHTAIQAAVDEMDREQIEAEAHRVKGVSIQMGANTLAEMCRTIERTAYTCSREDLLAILTRMESEMNRVITLLRQVAGELPS